MQPPQKLSGVGEGGMHPRHHHRSWETVMGQPSGIRPRSLGSSSPLLFSWGVEGKEAPRAAPPQGGAQPPGPESCWDHLSTPWAWLGTVFSNPNACCLRRLPNHVLPGRVPLLEERPTAV